MDILSAILTFCLLKQEQCLIYPTKHNTIASGGTLLVCNQYMQAPLERIYYNNGYILTIHARACQST